VSRLEGKHEQRAEAAPQGQLLPRIIGIMSDVDVCMSGHVPPQVALAEWSSMDNLQLREVLEKGPILFQEEFARVSVNTCAQHKRIQLNLASVYVVDSWYRWSRAGAQGQ
jgi:hypothetical protein